MHAFIIYVGMYCRNNTPKTCQNVAVSFVFGTSLYTPSSGSLAAVIGGLRLSKHPTDLTSNS